MRSLRSLCVYVRASTAGMLTVAIKTSISQTLRPELSPWFVSTQQKRATASLKQTKQYAQLNFVPSLNVEVFFSLLRAPPLLLAANLKCHLA